MQDLWDEEYTDLCRENFINAMYKFPDTPVTELENGREMPILGVGTWLKQNVQETIEQALRAGFRLPSQCALYIAAPVDTTGCVALVAVSLLNLVLPTNCSGAVHPSAASSPSTSAWIHSCCQSGQLLLHKQCCCCC